ncbi:Cdc48-dependent protein degradation adaptor protein-like protein [Amniculicola lignicola CBS 123094]|uniref:Cdc48-dependent protein degradation adaptor protein-like protein n=1 Tax=Amniculicola lignicola CBS 123094 TaxID=1392246 RepID=A0A6A5W3S3_9PLEO|nr:Cdc48-dependent protein degradation adaptor protein-like protein [Amniculicola lignicola CBS 123094]
MSSGPPDNQDELIAQFTSITGLAPTEAEQYLNAGGWNLETSAALFYEASDEPEQPQEQDIDMADEEPEHPATSTPNPPQQQQQQQQPGGGRTLGGTYVPPTASASSSSSAPPPRQAPQRGLRTLKDLQSGGAAGGHGHAHDDDDSDEDDHDENQDFFAGGEKSGLAVQNPGQQADPRDHINNILKRARQNVPRPGGDDEQPASLFRGTGMTLGGDDAPSRAIPDPTANVPQPAPRVHRELHLWRDGFSVDDGPLFRYDDPANARTLEMINTGHAPLHILNVEHGQEVDVEVHPHKDEDYKKPKKKWVPFGGSGQRLGSPTPGATSSAPPPAPAAAPSATAASSSTGPAPAAVEVDSSAPTISLQIRLGDGTRLQSRFNTTHTVGDVYGFVAAASPASAQREYALMTTFPSKELTDKGQVLGDMAEFKRGGVVVQKWK